MDCSTYREALSAMLDGERGPLPEAQVRAHLDACRACTGWYRRGRELRRSMAVAPAPPVPDLTAAILAGEVPAARPRGVAARSLRIALCVVGVVQLGLTFAQLFGFATGMAGPRGAMTTHLTHESAAWNIAVGIGLLWAAARTKSVVGQLPVFTGFAAALTGLSILDLVDGQVTIDRLLTHALVFVGLALLYAVRLAERDRKPGPAHDSLGAGGPARLAEDRAGGHPETQPAEQLRREEPPRPAGHHRAA